ncbi:MAG: hypothetical protein ACD_81C00016G0001 [uncultured bacterium]|uniref:Uncharacterized protein n=1 Tax=Candidatus Wolfebacteria bacterium GW2011_GWC2_39_22 TaxID=1619013 RepID=A0A0G0NIK5_9BACT|nr:MAG: hypothetical protein ACD_81C00016G0001 [uncultured bacterium]KKR12631.1 MAG: hypothetical protein UT41_C0001G0175 [Candidatus Wolfebacteria bacterium GW2011_GWC2_39_22]HBI25706.1 hypothetical protein [Candidatus Wolfebacteria bacterium]
MNEAASIGSKKWYRVLLERIDQKARCLCSLEFLQELGEGLRSTDLLQREREAIVAGLSCLLRDNAGNYEQSAITYLRALEKQLEQQQWYMLLLKRMACHAHGGGSMQAVIEAGEDLRMSELDENDRLSIIAELERMLHEDSEMYSCAAEQYFEMVLSQIRGYE